MSINPRATQHKLLALTVMVSLIATMFGDLVGLHASSAAAAAGDCLGSPTRRIRYTSDQVLHLEGCGQVFTLTDVAAAPAATAPDGTKRLELVDPANKIWFLSVDLEVEEGATLNLIGGEANWLRLRSDNAKAIALKAENGNLRFDTTRVTSWDATALAGAGDYDRDYVTAGRAFVAARSILTKGRETAPPTACDVRRGSQEPYEARMDIKDSEFAYLGYYAAESYGIAWKVLYKQNPADPNDMAPPGRQLYDMVDIFGDITGSTFHDNYFGTYTYGAYCMNWSNNTFDNNVEYGLDPHDDSDYLTIENNTFSNNGNHGLICSVYCNNLVIRNNVAHHNRHGIMLHRNVSETLVEGNQSYDNREAGIAIFDSHGNRILDNTSSNNGTAAMRLSVGASGNLIEGNILTGPGPDALTSGYVVYTYKGTDLPTSGDGRPKNNIFRNNVITGSKSPLLRVGQATGNEFVGNTVRVDENTATGPVTAFDFEFGVDNIVARTVFGPGFSPHLESSGDTTFSTTTILLDSAVGETVEVKLEKSSSTTLEDSAGHIWLLPESGLSTVAGPITSTLPLTFDAVGMRELITTLDFTARPARGTALVRPTLWQTTEPFHKSWIEQASAPTAGVAYQVGNLQAGQCYGVTANDAPLGNFAADNAGRISFIFGGPNEDTVSFKLTKATISCGPDTIAPTVSASPAGGVYNTAQTVTLTASEPATIYYTTDGTAPTAASSVYAAPLQIGASAMLQFFAVDAAGNQSAVVSEVYTFDTTASTVSASPAGGLYNTAQTVTLTASEPAAIYYTVDGSAPTTASSRYDAPLTINSATTLRFLAVDQTGNQSAESSEVYTFDTTAPTVSASPAGGLYNTAQTVTLTASEPAAIYYTVDGSAPTAASSRYDAPLTINSTTTLQFFAVDAASNESPVVSEEYTIDTAVPTVSANPAGGEYNTAQTVTLTASEPATIYYTTDGTTPTTASSRYTVPIQLTTVTKLQFFAVDAGGNQSGIMSAVYTVDTEAPETAIDNGPTGTVASTTARFVFSTNEEGATFECRLDNAPFQACASPMEYAGLSDGPHTFEVRALDAVGNVDQTPASRTWTVDTVPEPEQPSFSVYLPLVRR